MPDRRFSGDGNSHARDSVAANVPPTHRGTAGAGCSCTREDSSCTEYGARHGLHTRRLSSPLSIEIPPYIYSERIVGARNRRSDYKNASPSRGGSAPAHGSG